MNKTLLASTLLALPGLAFAQADGHALLQKAEGYRAARPDSRLAVAVTMLDAGGKAIKERAYVVYTAAAGKTVVVMKSPAEAGQKVLMNDDQYWMVLPGSQRPLRITPMQKLLGDAAVAEIATASWTEDYKLDAAESDQCKGAPCEKLVLEAVKPSVTYQRVLLWVDAGSGKPLSADLFLQSDKLAKQATFVVGNDGQGETVRQMTLTDKLAADKATRIDYGTLEKFAVPKSWLNPMQLASNPGLD